MLKRIGEGFVLLIGIPLCFILALAFVVTLFWIGSQI